MNYYFNVKKKMLHTEDCYYVKGNAKGRLFNENWIKFGSLNEAKKHCKNSGIKYKCCKICMN